MFLVAANQTEKRSSNFFKIRVVSLPVLEGNPLCRDEIRNGRKVLYESLNKSYAGHTGYQPIQEREQIQLKCRAGNVGKKEIKMCFATARPPVHVDPNDHSRNIVRGSAPRAARIFVITPANELMA